MCQFSGEGELQVNRLSTEETDFAPDNFIRFGEEGGFAFFPQHSKEFVAAGQRQDRFKLSTSD